MPPLPSDAEPRPPEDFAGLLATKEPVLLVGGQAVNLWALYYHSHTAELAPFVSRDVDVLGDRETLTALGQIAGAKPQFFPVKQRYAREELAGLLKAFPGIRIVGEAANAPQARERIAQLKPDLVFLDIQMPKESGLDLVSSLGNDAPRIIFTTAYDTYALSAFEFGATDYLLKPIAPKRLALALQRATGLGVDTPTNEEIDNDFGGLTPRPLRLDEKVLLSSAERIWYVPVGDIIGAESLGAYASIWLADATPVIRRSLAGLESRLPAELFIRANRSQLISLQHVQTVESWFSGGLKVTLKGGRIVELSRRQAKLFRERSAL